MERDLCAIAVMTAVISFLGFALENIWLAIRSGYIDNRNMRLPFLYGYGLAVVGFYFIAGTPDTFLHALDFHMTVSSAARHIAYFLLTFVIVSAGEILLGFFTEKYFGFYYWNYETIPLHITRYTSVPTSIGFALVITLFMDKCFVPLYNVIEKLPDVLLEPAAAVLTLLLSADFVQSFHTMHVSRAPNQRWAKYLRLSGNRKQEIR